MQILLSFSSFLFLFFLSFPFRISLTPFSALMLSALHPLDSSVETNRGSQASSVLSFSLFFLVVVSGRCFVLSFIP